jgi:hypothetical protein
MDEIRFNWRPIPGIKSALGPISYPLADIELQAASGDWKIFYPLVDSGASVSVFNGDDCDLLGYVLTDGIKYEIRGALGGTYCSYIHYIQLRIGNTITTARVAFTERAYRHISILGRIDVFDNYLIRIRGKTSESFFLKE